MNDRASISDALSDERRGTLWRKNASKVGIKSCTATALQLLVDMLYPAPLSSLADSGFEVARTSIEDGKWITKLLDYGLADLQGIVVDCDLGSPFMTPIIVEIKVSDNTNFGSTC